MFDLANNSHHERSIPAGPQGLSIIMYCPDQWGPVDIVGYERPAGMHSALFGKNHCITPK